MRSIHVGLGFLRPPSGQQRTQPRTPARVRVARVRAVPDPAWDPVLEASHMR